MLSRMDVQTHSAIQDAAKAIVRAQEVAEWEALRKEGVPTSRVEELERRLWPKDVA